MTRLTLAPDIDIDWTEVAARAHALLAQTLSDDQLDEILAHPRPPFTILPVLAG